MKNNDFTTSEYWSYEATCSLWGQTDIAFGVEFPEDSAVDQATLEQHLPEIERLIQWMEQHRKEIKAGLLAENMLSLAEDWVSGAEIPEDTPEDEEPAYYIVEDGQKIYLPIAEADFFSSLRVEGFTIYFEDGWQNPWIDCFLYCDPDYFAGHAINFGIDADGNIQNCCLAG